MSIMKHLSFTALWIAMATLGLVTACDQVDDMDDATQEASEVTLDVGETEQALAGDCDAVLAQGVFDNVWDYDHKESTYALSDWACRDQKSTTSGSHGASANILFGLVDASANNDFGKEEINNYCNHILKSGSSAETNAKLSRVANADIVNAWAQCMAANQDGLFCSYVKDDSSYGNSIQVRYEEFGNAGALKNITYTTTNMTVSPKPTTLLGTQWLGFTVPNKSLDGTVRINGKDKTGWSSGCAVNVVSDYKFHAAYKFTWEKIKADLAAYKTAINAIPATKNWEKKVVSSTLFRKPALATIDARIALVQTEINRCVSHNAACRMATADDYELAVQLRGFTCSWHTFPKLTVNVNLLVSTDNQRLAKLIQNWEQLSGNLSCRVN